MNTNKNNALAEIAICELEFSKDTELPKGDENTLYLDVAEVGKWTENEGPSVFLTSPDLLRERLGELEKIDDIRNRNLTQDYMVIVIDRVHSLEVRINLKKKEMNKYIENQRKGKEL